MFNEVLLQEGEQLALVNFEIDEGFQITPRIQSQAFERYQEFEKFRGWIVSEMNNIEFFIERIITNSLFKSSQITEKELFKENVLKQRYCGVWEKRQILRSILKSELHDIRISRKKLSTYRGNLQKLIEIRNKFAHNQIAIQLPSLSGVLKCSKDGKEVREEITDEYLDKIKKLHGNVLKKTLRLNQEIARLQT